MAKKLNDDELVMDGYKALYAAATPSVDFEELVNNCTRYVDNEGVTHFTDNPLNNDECRLRGWRKDIQYMDYELDEETYTNIVESKIKEHKLRGFRKDAFRTTMYLGCGPNIKQKIK